MITIDSAVYSSSSFATGTSTTAVGPVMLPQTLTVTFEIHWETLAKPMTFVGNTVTRNDCNGLGSFITDGFTVGDNIVITGSIYNDGAYVISSMTATTITITTNFPRSGQVASSVNIYGNTELEAMDFYDADIQNAKIQSPTFFSLTDTSNICKYTASWTTDTSPGSPVNQAMLPQGYSQAWVLGSNPVVTYIGSGTATPYSRQFQIVHTRSITPFYRSSDFLNIQQTFETGSAVPPQLWNTPGAAPALPGTVGTTQGVARTYAIVARRNAQDTVIRQISNYSNLPQGNTWWFNSQQNGGTPNFKVASITYKLHGTSIALDEMDYLRPCDVTINLTSANTGSHVFSNGTPNEITLNFNWLPSNQSAYQNQPINLSKCFLNDSVSFQLGNSSVNGDHYGTPYQLFTNVVSTYNSSSSATITFTTVPGTAITNGLSGGQVNGVYPAAPGNANYMFTATVGGINETMTTLGTTSVICDVNSAITSTDETGVLNIVAAGSPGSNDILFYKYPNLGTAPTTDDIGFAGDYRYAECGFNIQSGYSLVNVTANINYQVTDPNGNVNTYPLQTYTFNTAAYATQTYAGEISINDTPNFALPSTMTGSITPAMAASATYSFTTNPATGPQTLTWTFTSPVGTTVVSGIVNPVTPNVVADIEAIFAAQTSTYQVLVTEVGTSNAYFMTIYAPAGTLYNGTTCTLTFSSTPYNPISPPIPTGVLGSTVTLLGGTDTIYGSPVAYPYNAISMNRNPQLDGGSPQFYGYQINFAYQHGYQYWLNRTPYSPIFTAYHTNYWPVYTQGYATPQGQSMVPVGYSVQMQFQFIFNVQNIATGNVTQYIQNANLYSYDNANGGIGYGNIFSNFTTQDNQGNNLNGIVAQDIQTQVTWIFSGVNIADPPTGTSTIVGKMTYWYNQSGLQVYDMTDSLNGNQPDSYWITPVFVNVIDNNTVSLSAIIDLTQSPTPVLGRMIASLDYV
jgi:hypothetical protein